MFFKKNSTFIIILLMFCNAVYANNSLKRFTSIEFRGLHYLSKYELVRKSNIKRDGSDIIVNIETLREILSNMSLVASYKISEENNRLILSITEREPVMQLVLAKGNKLIPFELDKTMEIISINRIYSNDLPMIFITEKDIIEGRVNNKIVNFYKILKNVSENYEQIYNEIKEIYLLDKEIKIYLTGRKTSFLLKPVNENFIRLKYITGYLDRIHYYPDELKITSDRILIK